MAAIAVMDGVGWSQDSDHLDAADGSIFAASIMDMLVSRDEAEALAERINVLNEELTCLRYGEFQPETGTAEWVANQALEAKLLCRSRTETHHTGGT